MDELEAWRKRAEIAEARVLELSCALKEYIYQTTHLATSKTVGDCEYRKALIKYSAIKEARDTLGD